jgi:hypothetical protein
MVEDPTSQLTRGEDVAVRSSDRHARPDRGRDTRRRCTLGPCAHCHEPIAIDDEHVRLYRLVWHLECALAAGTPSAGLPPSAL